ncbi:MAG: alpha/beta fold hydrolase, partial [Reyranellaceae bacterium]
MSATDERFARLRPTIPPLRTAVLAGPPAMAGLTLGWREGGTAEAPALVCLHGIGSNATGYRYQFDGFGGRLRVVAWDAPG